MTLNFNLLILCLKRNIDKIVPKTPPKNESKCRVFSLILHLLFFALNLSKEQITKAKIFINK